MLGAGIVLIFLAFVLPSDWSKLALNFPGGSVEVERARAAQDTLLALPHSAQEQLDSEALVAGVAEQTPEEVGAGAADNLAETRERLAARLADTRAVASHDEFEGWIRLRLKRRLALGEGATGVICAVRKPNGTLFSGVPRLIGPVTPPLVLGLPLRSGPWVDYEITFPDWFTDEDADSLTSGSYLALWGTVPAAGRPHVLATDNFEWPVSAESTAATDEAPT